MNYSLRRTNPDSVRRICERFGVDFLSANILVRRGITGSQEIKYILESGINCLHSPFLFTDMEEAVERILACQEDGTKVALFGDRDADGITATALLASELREMNIDTVCHLPQGDDPYGLTMDAVSLIIEEGAGLVITLDNGIVCNREIEELSRRGIDTIVVDHHIASDTLPEALAVINPKVASSGYPFEGLAACALSAKLIWALRFAQTPLYKSRVILLHAQPGPGEDTTTIVQAVELYNLVETNRIIEELPNRAVNFETSPLVRLLMKNVPILVLDRDTELRQLRMAFGPSVDISLTEIRGELEAVIPAVRGKNLFSLTTQSRAALYADGNEEIETLESLFISCCIYKYRSLSSEYMKILDLVAIGTIADMMSLVDENRILVRLGLRQLSSKPRENLVQLMSAQNLLSHPLTVQDIAWYISPVINASGRLGCPEVALNLLMSKDEKEMYELTVKLLELNKERQRRGEEAWSTAITAAKESLESFGSKFMLVDTGTISRGLTGSIASRALNEFSSAPAVIVLSRPEDGRISASMRAHSGVNCREFLARFESFFTDFGGHRAAAGFSMPVHNREGFLKALDEEVLAMDLEVEEEELEVDAIVTQKELNNDIVSVVSRFEPYGEAFSPLIFMYEGAKISEIITLGDESKGNVKLMVRAGNRIWPCLWWGARRRDDFNYAAGDEIRMVFRLNHNYYRGIDTVQLTVLDAEKM